MRLWRWGLKGWGILRARPSRLEVATVALGISLVLLVQAGRVRNHAAQLARREQLVQQEWHLVKQMAGNVSRVERNLSEMQNLTKQFLANLPQGGHPVVEPPPPLVVLSPEERDDSPRAADPPSVRR